jgi:hypothetical protein
MHNLDTLAVAVIFMAVYASASRLYPLQIRFHKNWLSVGAGVSVAYVFLDILPELGIHQERLLAHAVDEGIFATEKLIYIAALVGFVFFYGLENIVLASAAENPHDDHGGSTGAFWLEVAGFALYSWLIGYLLVEIGEEGERSLGLYAAAMGLHLMVVGHTLVHEHGKAYDRWVWWILGAAVIGGWLFASTMPMPHHIISEVFAFVAGGVVMTSMHEELPDAEEGRFWWFLGGSGVYAIVLLIT